MAVFHFPPPLRLAAWASRARNAGSMALRRSAFVVPFQRFAIPALPSREKYFEACSFVIVHYHNGYVWLCKLFHHTFTKPLYSLAK